MNKTLAAKALDDAFAAHVATKFSTLCAGSNEAGYAKAEDAFAADFRFAQRAHADAVRRLASEDADVPELEDDAAYRARIIASIGPSPRNHRAVAVAGPALDGFGAQPGVNVKRGRAPTDDEKNAGKEAPLDKTDSEVKADQEAQARKNEARANDTSGREDLNRGAGPGGTAQPAEAHGIDGGAERAANVASRDPLPLGSVADDAQAKL